MVAAEPSGANCANGGASVTDGTGKTVYACNGATGPKGDTGPVGAQGAPGSPGASGTGATVASLASGDPNCANGGASITDGNGSTAYACNGANGTGTTDLQAFQVIQDTFNLPAGPRIALPGLSETVTPATDSVYVMNATITAFFPTGSTGVDCQMAIDGGLRAFPDGAVWVSSDTPKASMPLTAAFPLSAGTHTIQILCFASQFSVSVEGTMTGFNAG